MTSESSRIALATGPSLSYAEQGDRSGPALVLLPGPTDSWWSYQPTLARLPRSIRSIAVSQRGHGDSDKPATGYRVEDFAADVVALLDALHIEQAVLAGHSGSCPVARRVAIDFPERVAGLVLEASPVTLHGEAGLTAFVESIVTGPEDRIDPDFARDLVVATSSGGLEPDLLDQLTREVVKVPARVWREMFAELLQYDDTAELARITAPALLIWGDADGVIGREMQEQLAMRMPRTKLVVYPGVGHTPRWEDPSRFAADVAAFVERLLPARS
jgi:non-heme chloroperoxidase